jgi:hypothetical protein
MVKKEIIFALMIVSMFLISACDVYNTLYIKQAEQGEAVEVPEGDIIIDIDVSTEEEAEEDIKEEIIEEITGETIEEVEMEDVEMDIEDIFEEEELEEGIDMEEGIAEDATVLIVEETELISLVPKAEDPDKDTLTFTFTSPLDENGEWQTTYGDAGEYTVTVTASDGSLTASKEVLIIINRKEEAPVFDSFEPEETAIEMDEIDSVAFKVAASDLNDDILEYLWKLDGIEIGDDDSIEYQTTYEDSGSHTVKVTISDGMFDTEKIWSVTVNNVNRKPLLTEMDDIEARETDTVVIELEAVDHDGDELSYEIDDERFTRDENVFTWETTYDNAGEYIVLVSVSDGVDTVSQEVTVTIENVNRAPVILDIVQK